MIVEDGAVIIKIVTLSPTIIALHLLEKRNNGVQMYITLTQSEIQDLIELLMKKVK